MIDEIALKKKLAVDFLRKLGVSNGRKNSLAIRYYDKSGHQLTTRYRQEHEGKKPTYPVKPGTKLVPYGLWMLDKFNQDFLLIVEGESDCWTAWNTEISCLGIPGAQNDSCLSLDDVTQFSRLYVWQEPDARGKEFPARIASHLKALGYEGTIKSISHPEFKDISELHIAQPDEIVTYRHITDCINQSNDIELKTWNDKKNVKPSPLHSSYKSRKPNKPLTEKLDEWVKTYDGKTDSRTDKIYLWLLAAFDSTTTHSIVERTFAAHPFIQKWFTDRGGRENDWPNIVKRAYDLWATPRRQIYLESARSPLVQLSADEFDVTEDFQKFIENFEQKNGLKLNHTAYHEVNHLTLMHGKQIYEAAPGAGKSTAAKAVMLYHKDKQFLYVAERKAQLKTMKRDLEKNGETDVGLIIGYKDDDCIAETQPNRYEAYDKKNSPCKTCKHECDFKNSFLPEKKNEQLNKRILLLTHRMFMSFLSKGEIQKDRIIVVDEVLKNFEDFKLTRDIEDSVHRVFPFGSTGNKPSTDHLDYLRKMTRDGCCDFDKFDSCCYQDYQDMVDYIPKLQSFTYEKLRKELQSPHNRQQRIDDLENCLSWLNFLRGSPQRAAFRTGSSIKLRSVVRELNLDNPIIILSASASISRTKWEGFTIYKSSMPLPEYISTVIHALVHNPTMTKLEKVFPTLKEAFVDFILKQPEEYKAWMAINKNFPELAPLLEEITEYIDIQITRGHIPSNNDANHCHHALIACSIFTDLSDYVLGACLHRGSKIKADEIYKTVTDKDGIKKVYIRMTRNFDCADIQSEYIRQSTDEIYQTILRGVIRSQADAPYDCFCLLGGLEIAINLLHYLPGAKIVRIDNSGIWKLLEIYEKYQPKSLQKFINKAKLKVDDVQEIEYCKQIFFIKNNAP